MVSAFKFFAMAKRTCTLSTYVIPSIPGQHCILKAKNKPLLSVYTKKARRKPVYRQRMWVTIVCQTYAGFMWHAPAARRAGVVH